MKKEFLLFYSSWYTVIKDLPAEIKLEIYEATIEYGLYGTTTELTPMANIAFGFIKDDIDRNAKTYEEIKKQRSEAGRKGSEARWGKPSQNNDGDQPVESDSTPSQPITDDNNQSQNIANDGKTSQSIANDGKKWQSIANDGKKWQTMANDSNEWQKWHNKNKNKNENKNKNISLSLTPSQSDVPSETEKEREREDFIFKNLFWLNRKKPKEETQRLIDNYQSQGWRKANGREITDILPIVRMWKCEEEGVRMPRSNLDFLRKILSAVNLQDNANALREVDSVQSENEMFYLVCTRKFAEFLQSKVDVVQPILNDFLGDKTLKVKLIK